eukprot:s2669_g1.t1
MVFANQGMLGAVTVAEGVEIFEDLLRCIRAQAMDAPKKYDIDEFIALCRVWKKRCHLMLFSLRVLEVLGKEWSFGAAEVLGHGHPGCMLRRGVEPSSKTVLGALRAVPQVDDYVRVWRYLVNGSSLRSTEQLTFTESFLNCSRSEAESVKRRAASQILQVMQENVRRRKLDCLLRFSSATFLLDDNGEHRVIRYFTNLGGQEQYGSGIIAVLRHGGRATSASITEFEQDYSQRVADSVVEASQIFCKGNPDVWDHMQEITRCFTSDACSAALKAGRCLPQHFRNLTVVHRDLSHAIRPLVAKRLAGQKPMLAEDDWAFVQESLFGKKGVRPNLQNSAEWQARFLALQKDLAGSRWDGPVKKAVKHMSFAKQRWNSEDEP